MIEKGGKIVPEKKETTQNIQRDFVINSLFSVLKAKTEKSEKKTEELISIIKKLDTNGKIDWPTILIKIMEIMKSKNQEIKELWEKNIGLWERNVELEIEVSKLKLEEWTVNESIMKLVNINLEILDEVHNFKAKTFKK